MRVVADQDLCMSSQQCSGIAPLVFDQDEDGIVVVRQAVVPDELREGVEFAARICPSGAIRLLDEE